MIERHNRPNGGAKFSRVRMAKRQSPAHARIPARVARVSVTHNAPACVKFVTLP
jgi:hypothetical protein